MKKSALKYLVSFALGVLAASILQLCLFSSHNVIFENGILVQNTWRYRTAAVAAGDRLYVATYDKMTKKLYESIYSTLTDSLISEAVIDSRSDSVVSYDSGGNLLHQMYMLK